jgi:hypothetical protein
MAFVIDTGEGNFFEITIIRGWEESGSRKNVSKKYRNNVPLSNLMLIEVLQDGMQYMHNFRSKL